VKHNTDCISGNASGTYKYEPIDINMPKNPTKEGYFFGGWFTSGTEFNYQTTYKNWYSMYFFGNAPENFTLYAYWIDLNELERIEGGEVALPYVTEEEWSSYWIHSLHGLTGISDERMLVVAGEFYNERNSPRSYPGLEVGVHKVYYVYSGKYIEFDLHVKPATLFEGINYIVHNGEAHLYDAAENLSGELVIPDTVEGFPVTKILTSALRGQEITSVSIPSSVEHIFYLAFSYCKALEYVYINRTAADGDKMIGAPDLKESKNLKNIYIYDEVYIPYFREYADKIVVLTK